jgi:AraC-like DNA-binding protein
VTGRDRLRELLDAVLDEEHRSLADMAHGAYASPFHFSRRLARDTGEPPVAMRRRVALERAAWQLAQGAAVTETAFAAGYGSVEGFARAYGHPPSAATTGPTAGSAHWLPAPNGIHFHAPDGLWVEGSAQASAGEVTALMVHHDVDDVRTLVELAKGLDPAEYARNRLPGLILLCWAGSEGSIAALLNRCVAPTRSGWPRSRAPTTPAGSPTTPTRSSWPPDSMPSRHAGSPSSATSSDVAPGATA